MGDEIFQNDNLSKERPTLPIVIKYGNIGIGILFLIALIQTYVLGLRMDGNSLSLTVLGVGLIILSDLIYFILMVLAVWTYKKANGGYILFKNAFQLSFLTGVYIAFVSMFFYVGINKIYNSDSFPDGGALIYFMTSFVKKSLLGLVIAIIISTFMKRGRTSGVKDQ